MSKFKTKNINLSQATVISFTVAQDKCEYKIGVKNHTITVTPDYNFNDDTSIITLPNFSYEQETLISYTKPQEVIVININNNTLLNKEIMVLQNYETDIYQVYFKSQIQTQQKSIYDGQNFFIFDSKYQVVPQYSLINDQQYLITNDGLVLLSDMWVLRDLHNNPISRVESSNETIYSDDKILSQNQHRDRIVISDSGRILSFSVKHKQEYELLNSFIFPEKLNGEVFVTLEIDNTNAIKDITANF